MLLRFAIEIPKHYLVVTSWLRHSNEISRSNLADTVIAFNAGVAAMFGGLELIRRAKTSRAGGAAPPPPAILQLTERAAENVLKEIADRGFPPGTAVRIEDEGRGAGRRFEVRYDDLPTGTERDLRGQSRGITILIDRRIARPLDGAVVDFDGEQYVFGLTTGDSGFPPLAHN
jgi:Fe-S cluster assembly iron-binding protein IscA